MESGDAPTAQPKCVFRWDRPWGAWDIYCGLDLRVTPHGLIFHWELADFKGAKRKLKEGGQTLISDHAINALMAMISLVALVVCANMFVTAFWGRDVSYEQSKVTSTPGRDEVAGAVVRSVLGPLLAEVGTLPCPCPLLLRYTVAKVESCNGLNFWRELEAQRDR